MSVATIRRVVCRMGPDYPPTDAELVTAISPVGAAGVDREAAFAELLGRYGPMVLGVCRRVLGDVHDAEDAFQAAFLVLARKAGSIRPPGAVAGWLYGVAVRTARKAKTAAARRRRREMATAEANRVSEPAGSSLENAELRAVIDAELAALPDPHRAAIVLCDLHGKTRAEAAAELNRPEGTVAAWLARGRKALAARLARRGVALPAAGLVAVVTPAAVSAQSVSAAVAIFLGRGVSAGVLALAEGVMKSLSSTSTKLAAAVVAVGSLLAAVATATAWYSGDANPPLPNTPAPATPVAAAPPAAAPNPKPAPGAVAWKETKVLGLAGWICGSVAYSHDGKTLFIGGTNGIVRAYDTASWKQLWEYGSQTNCPSVAVSPDDKTLAVSFADADRRWGVRMVNAATGKLDYSLEEGGVPGVSGDPHAVGFFPDVTLLTGRSSTSHKLVFGTAGQYVVKTWIDPEKPSTITSRTVAAGKQAADNYAVPLAIDPEGKRVVVTGPIDKDTGTNVLWAWSAGSGAPNKLLEGHKERVVCAGWSKNGKVIVTGDDAGVVIVWDATTFKEKSRVKIGGRIAAVAASPDGMGIAASAIRPSPTPMPGQPGCTGDVFTWLAAFPPEKPEPLSSTQLGTPFKGIASLAFAPDGKSLASTFANFVLLTRSGILIGQVRIYSVVSAEPEKPAPTAKNVTDVSFSPDGKKYVAVVSGKAEVFDTATGKQLYSVAGQAARFSADGKKLLVMADKVLECDPNTGKALKSYDRPKTKFAWHKVAFSPDGKRFAANFGIQVRVYDTATGKEVPLNKQFEPPGGVVVGSAAPELRWSPDGKAIVAGGILVAESQMGIAVWEIESGVQQIVFNATANKETGVATFGPEWGRVAVASKDIVELWVLNAEVKKNPERTYRAAGPVTAVAFSKDAKLIAVGARLPILNGADKPPPVIGHKTIVQVFDTTTAEEVKRFDGFEGVNHMAPTKLPVTALAFAPDGKKLIAGTGISVAELNDPIEQPGEVKVFDLTAIPEKPAAADQKWTDTSILEDHGRLVNGVAIAPDGKSFAAATEGNVTCWDSATRKVLWKYAPTDSGVFALAYSPDGKHLCIAAKTDVIRLDVKTGKADPWTGDEAIWFGRMGAIAYHPKGERLAATDGYVARVRTLDAKGEAFTLGAPPKESEPAPEKPAGLAWSPDGKWLAVILPQQEGKKWPVTLWNVEGKVNDTKLLVAHDAPVTAVAWSKDGKFIASGDEKGLVILWDAATSKELWRKKFTGRDDTDGAINALSFSPADNTLATAVSLGSGKQPERVVLFAAADGKDVAQLMRPWKFPVDSVSWSKDGKFLVTGCGVSGRIIAQTEINVGEVVVWERKP